MLSRNKRLAFVAAAGFLLALPFLSGCDEDDYWDYMDFAFGYDGGYDCGCDDWGGGGYYYDDYYYDDYYYDDGWWYW